MLNSDGQAGTTEIEVTPAMIEAALEPFAAYETFDPEWSGFSYAEVAEIIPSAIARALGQSGRKG